MDGLESDDHSCVAPESTNQFGLQKLSASTCADGIYEQLLLSTDSHMTF
jgi:hypothetical protein